MEGEEGLGMTRIRMSTLNLCSGNQCEWTLVLLPLWPASPVLLGLVTSVAPCFFTSSPCPAL